MSVAFPYYAKIKDRYCITYLGCANEYITQLILLLPNMEKEFPGLQIYIAGCDKMSPGLSHNKLITESQLRQNDRAFAYIRELRCNLTDHPIEAFMEESNIPIMVNNETKIIKTNKCAVFTKGIIPTKSLNEEQEQEIYNLIRSKGFQPVENGCTDDAAWVVGVECVEIFKAAANGIAVTLLDTGLGSNLFKKMFPSGNILKF